ncbi:EcoKI restriction-modification system protein HsdS [Aliarcobacter thereius]|uniref:EcoKI restriction-modification system protein HsdS n=1 Tax=Aliarcobacter thereius TaxID=544718 RepID=A0A1C0B8Q5_9BACT|nr:restriction endonuclease subunit S [Aliarcobacter thereius]OCL99995.1 EcoKI restriction-modification system protein HsdS [Aliarcobacter thereius]
MSKNINVPKLRFKEFSGEWEEKKLGDIVTFYNSKRIPLTETDREKGIYPYYGASGIIDYVKDYIFDGEYILLGEDGANIVLRNSRLVFLANGKFWLNNHAHIFKAKESNYFLCEILERINYTKYNTGTAQPKLNAEVVKKIKIKIPQKEEQEKIALFLGSVDKKIEKLTKKNELLQQYKKSIMQKIFSQEIRFKDDKGKEFPEWEEKELRDIFISIKGKGLSKNDLVDNGQNKCILYGELYTTYPEVIKEIKSFTNSNDGIKSIYGDLLIPCSTTTTGIDLANATALYEDNVLLGGDITILRFKKKGNSTFYAYFLTHFKKYDLAKFGQGSTIVHLYFEHFKNMKIKIPLEIKEQNKIANFLSSIDYKIEENQKILEKTKEFKKSLLQQMFV